MNVLDQLAFHPCFMSDDVHNNFSLRSWEHSFGCVIKWASKPVRQPFLPTNSCLSLLFPWHTMQIKKLSYTVSKCSMNSHMGDVFFAFTINRACPQLNSTCTEELIFPGSRLEESKQLLHLPLANAIVMFHFWWQKEVRNSALLSSSTL